MEEQEFKRLVIWMATILIIIKSRVPTSLSNLSNNYVDYSRIREDIQGKWEIFLESGSELIFNSLCGKEENHRTL